MIYDVIEYESTNHQYMIYDRKIGYLEADLISTNTNIGYQTLFACYLKQKEGEISKETLE